MNNQRKVHELIMNEFSSKLRPLNFEIFGILNNEESDLPYQSDN